MRSEISNLKFQIAKRHFPNLPWSTGRGNQTNTPADPTLESSPMPDDEPINRRRFFREGLRGLFGRVLLKEVFFEAADRKCRGRP